MTLFKSREERRIERNIEIRKGLNQIRGHVKNLERNEIGYVEKAKRAKQLGDPNQLAFLKKTIRKTLSQKLLLEKQLLNLETAIQIKSQTEAHAQFAKAMSAISKTIAEMFGAADLTNTQKDFEIAMSRAENMEERMSLFLESSEQAMFSGETASEETISDEEIDRLIESEAAFEEKKGIDEEIAKGLAEIDRELEKDRK